MTQGEMDRLRESCSFSSEIHIRLFEANETIASTRPGKLVFVFPSLPLLGGYYITITSTLPSLTQCVAKYRRRGSAVAIS